MRITLLLLFLVCLYTPNLLAQSSVFKFVNKTVESGLSPKIDSIHAHGAGWGDIDGDGWPDLFIGVFSDNGRTSMLFHNAKGHFKFDDQKAFRIPTRLTGVVFADFDNDGDEDLYIGSMPKKPREAYRKESDDSSESKADKHVKPYPQGSVGNSLFRNEGKGNYSDISKFNVACPDSFGGRSVAVFDYDGDGLLDILAGEDPMTGYNGSKTKSSRLFKNVGGFKFIDVSKIVGIPENVPAYGVAACDVNNDGWPDFFLAGNDGGNRLFLNDKKGKFYENEKLNQLFKWQWSGGSNMVCGVAFGDVNRDGLMDIVMGSHFQFPWLYPQPVRLFLNKGEINNELCFEEVTLKASLPIIYIKTPHVEIQDFDNDGWPDIFTSAVKFKDGVAYPLISRNLGVNKNKIPRFTNDANNINDFPTSEEMNFMRSNSTANIFLKIQNDKRITYFASGPTADYDNDGLLDLILPSWWSEFPSLLLHNETINQNNWLKVKLQNMKKVNSTGVGSKINVYRAGELGKIESLIGCKEISIGSGYASGPSSIAHFGLGKSNIVDIEVVLPHNKGTIVKKGVHANTLITIED